MKEVEFIEISKDGYIDVLPNFKKEDIIVMVQNFGEITIGKYSHMDSFASFPVFDTIKNEEKLIPIIKEYANSKKMDLKSIENVKFFYFPNDLNAKIDD